MKIEIDYAEYYHLCDIGIVDLLHKYGKSGVVSWTIPFGVLDILCNRKEGVVGSMIRENSQLLPCGRKNESR